jgi:serine/threonine-protein kinase RsbW
MTGASRAPSAEAVQTFASGPDSAREARRWVEPVLGPWVEPPVITDALLVVSELVTNAVMHGDGPVRVRVLHCSGYLRVEVSDDGGGDVIMRDTDPESTGGRGMLVVAHVARAWGVIGRAPAGKTVWAEVASPR